MPLEIKLMQAYESSYPYNQANTLHDAATTARVIAVTAGKGGVGKTNVSVNLAIALAMQDKRVLLFDADLGLANAHVLLGLHANKNLSHILKEECELSDILIEGPAGIKIIPSSSGIEEMTKLSLPEHAGIINAFNSLAGMADFLMIDTAAGISETVTTYIRSSQEVIIVVCDEPTSITDAYALIKVLSKEHHITHFKVLANMVKNSREGRELFDKLNRVSERFLDVVLDHLGTIPYDDCLKKSVKQQMAVVCAYPSSISTTEFKKVAKQIVKWSIRNNAAEHIPFFMNRLLQENN
jgi:flagellar biosynthesis protein FlhG